MADRTESSLRIPFAWSLLLHAVLLGGFVWFGMQSIRSSGETGDKRAASRRPVERTPQEDTEHYASRIQERIESGLAQSSASSEQQKLTEADAGAQWLEANSSERAIAEVAARVREAYAAPERAYAPAVPPPPGTFHHASMLPYRSERRTDTDGVERSYQTWVDREGRTMIQTRRRYTDADGSRWMVMGVVQPDGSLYELSPERDDGSLDGFDAALGRTGESGVVQQIFSEALLPVLEARRRGRAVPRELSPAVEDAERGSPSPREGEATPIRRSVDGKPRD